MQGSFVGGRDQSNLVWILSVNETEFGPVSLDQLKTLKAKGLLKPEQFVCHVDQSNWITAAEIPDLFAPKIQKAIRDIPPQRREQAEHKPAVAEAEHSNTARSPSTKRRNYLVRHWRGELSLPVSYWINGFLGNIFIAIVVAVLVQSMSNKDEFRPEIALLTSVTIWASIAVVGVWQIIGTWRSASNYSAANPNQSWGGVAKFFLVIAAIRLVGSFTGTGAPQIAEYYKIYDGDADVGKYAFKISNDSKQLEFSGGISFGAAKAFDRFADAMGSLTTVRLTSAGGRIAEAQRIANSIKARGLNTFVDDYCVSACTILFLSGRERIITPDSRIGFHQPYFPGMSADDRRDAIATEEKRLILLGVSAAFARKANSASPGQMWYPNEAELLAEHVATRFISKTPTVGDFRFRSDDGKISALFPGAPKLTKDRGTTRGGATYDQSTWAFSTETNSWMVMLLAYDRDLEFNYERAIAGAVANTNGKLISQKSILKDRNEGREILVRTDSLDIRQRMFWIGRRMYQVMQAGKIGTLEDPSVDYFLDSFHALP